MVIKIKDLTCLCSFKLTDGNSHLWHKKNSTHHTDVLGRLACIVCSKILGIGSAERSWGDVKHLKSNKRAKLSGKAVEMQATIFGASCSERSKLKEEGKDIDAELKQSWDDDDFADAGLDATTKLRPNNFKKRIFRAWLEDWEPAVQSKQDPVNEAKLLMKYGGLVWKDPDTKATFMACKEQMHWSVFRDTRGYCLKGLLETYDPDNPKDDDWEPWVFDPEVLHCLIVEYYEKHPAENMVVVRKGEKTHDVDDDDGENDEEDNKDEEEDDK